LMRGEIIAGLVWDWGGTACEYFFFGANLGDDQRLRDVPG
jgi:hypothetical protein